ncbi:cupredoxin domain-containing protein [Motiliproteus sediminis]|uniref:cupredoxin domain-containing protein n=1 Tax=Motiliproteus sediminis TaxID=1468178 RepID=UPI001AEF434E|nr:cupredoxin domain-containing protein [Motiliproteus sediminis]
MGVKAGLTGLVLGLNLAVTGPVYAEAGHDDPTITWMPANIDWKKAETISILLEDNLFTPDDVVLTAGKPYKLVLTNVSDRHEHDLVDLAFFHSVVFQKLIIGGVEIDTPHAHSLLLEPNTSANLYLVPVKTGEYEVYCSVEGHRDDGMEGFFTIEAAE